MLILRGDESVFTSNQLTPRATVQSQADSIAPLLGRAVPLLAGVLPRKQSWLSTLLVTGALSPLSALLLPFAVYSHPDFDPLVTELPDKCIPGKGKYANQARNVCNFLKASWGAQFQPREQIAEAEISSVHQGDVTREAALPTTSKSRAVGHSYHSAGPDPRRWICSKDVHPKKQALYWAPALEKILERERETCTAWRAERSLSPNSLLAKGFYHILYIQDNRRYSSQCFEDLALSPCVSYLLPCNTLPPNRVA